MKVNKSQQTGFVSIFSTLIIMSVIALIIIGFTYSTRQATRRTLDDQLNTQAYYSAESGINNAIANLSTFGAGSTTTCSSDDIDTDLGAGYSCVLVDLEPPQLVYSNVPVGGSGAPIIANVETAEGVNYFRFDFDSADDITSPIPTTGFSGNRAEFTDVAGWGTNVGVLRVDVIPFDDLSRAGLENNSYTFFLYPTSVGGSNSVTVASGQAQRGDVFLVNCNNPSGLRCGITVNLTGGGADRQQYKARLQSIYNPVQTNLEVQNASGNVLSIENGQAVIDSTGRANDVYKRIQARIPLSGAGGFRDGSVGNAAISSALAVCKRYEAVPGATNVNDPGLGAVSLVEYCGFN